jgi:outer membrane protein assembly factor BamB
MQFQRVAFVVLTSALAGTIAFAQPGRGGSMWLTPFGDAQRTSWIRSDDKISVATMSKSGFDLQWKSKLDNQPRGVHGLAQGVTAAGVTLFVPMSIVTGSSNNVYAIDNDIGYVVWQRHFEATVPPPSSACAGGITSGATRIVRLNMNVASAPAPGGFGRASVGYRTLLGEPGQGVPTEGRLAGPGRGAGAGPGAPAAAGGRQTTPGRGAAPAPPGPAPGGRNAQPVERIPGSPRTEEGGGGFGFLFRPSGVVYVISSDGMLHVLGLASGKDIQRPAKFLPANAKWSSPVAADTTMYAATSGDCGGAPSAIWAIDLDSEAKPVVSWKTTGGSVVGAVAFTSDGTLIASIGPGQATGDGKANAIVALDPKTLQVKDWFTQPTAEFVTGPTIIRHKDKEVVAAATKDGRVILLDAASLGGANHDTPLHASKPFLATGGTVSADALAAWQQTNAGDTTSWIMLPVNGRLAAASPTNGPITNGAVVALKVVDAKGALSLAPGWISHDVSMPSTPIIVNGVVFALGTGLPASADGKGTAAVAHAYDGATGKRFWTSGKAMTTFASPGSFWSSLGQIYIGTQDGTLHAFGFNDERRATTGGT